MASKDIKKDQQIKGFRKAARELGADESEERFNDALRKVGKHKVKPSDADGAAELKGDPS